MSKATNPEKSATFKAYCKQAYFAPSIDGDGDIEWFFTSYDGSSRIPPPYDGNGLVNGELQQQSPNSSVFLMDWISPSYVEQYFYGNSLSWAFTNPDNYGMVSLNMSYADRDGNGVVDWMQKDLSVNEQFSGQLVVHTMNNMTASVNGSLYRSSGSGSGRYSITYYVPGESGTSSGDWIVGYYEGTFTYDDKSCRIDATTMDAQGNIKTVSGSTTYSSLGENQININTLDLKVNSAVVRINGKSLTRNGNVYSASVKAVDGGTASSWPDFQDWYLEITDPNDSDNDGIPDLSDRVNAVASFFSTVGNDLGAGWRNSEWFGAFYPSNSGWVFHKEHGWIYIVTESLDSIWYWHERDKWCWLNQTSYPWVWFHEEQCWKYFFKQSSTWFALPSD